MYIKQQSKEHDYLDEVINQYAPLDIATKLQILSMCKQAGVSYVKLSSAIECQLAHRDLNRISNFSNWLMRIIQDTIAGNLKALKIVNVTVAIEPVIIRLDELGFTGKNDESFFLENVLSYIVNNLPGEMLDDRDDLNFTVTKLIDDTVAFLNFQNKPLTFVDFCYSIAGCRTVRKKFGIDVPLDELRAKAIDDNVEIERLLSELEDMDDEIPDKELEKEAMKDLGGNLA